MINHYIISSNLTWITTLALVAFVYLRGQRSRMINIFCFYMINISLWSFSWSRLASATDAEAGLFWARALHLGATLIPTAFFHFSLTFQPESVEKKWKPVVIIGYAFSVLFLLISFSNWFVPGTASVSGLKFYGRPGPLYIYFVLFFAIYSCLAFWALITAYRESSGLKRNQLRYVLVSYTIAWAGGCPAFLPIYGFNMWAYSLYGVPLCILILTYAVLAHRLLDIGIFIRRAGLLIMVYFILVVVAAPFIYMLHSHVGNLERVSTFILGVEVFLLAIILSLGPFLYAYIVRSNYWFKGQLSTGLAHELKSPLSSIQGSIEVLRSELKKNKTDKIEEYIEMVDKNTSRLQRFVAELLDLAKIHHGELSLDKTNINLKEAVSNLTREYASLARSKNITFQTTIDPTLTIHADSAKLDQILSNILSNAIKFSRKGQIRISAGIKDSYMVCSFQDEGQGIAKHGLNKIFDRFYHGSTSNKGSGIGLAIAKGWVEAHGGKIWAESEGEGKGCTITFTLPNS